MKVRLIAVCTLLLLAAVPSFALPLCQECNEVTNRCETVSGAFERCKYDAAGNCYLDPFERCSIPRASSTVLADWKVVSIEMDRPATDAVTATAPAAVLEVPAATTSLTNLK